MASGLPVVTSALPVLKNVIEDRVNGLTVPINDIKGISEAIYYIIDHPFDADKIGFSARQYTLKTHTFSAWEKDLTNIYHSLIGQDKKNND